MDDAEDLI
jgi:hypothetical protein